MTPVLGMFLAGLLLLLGVLSSKFSARLGVPVLVVFVAIGMLAGSEGLGRIPFEDYALASGVGSAALAVILFDGGLRTTWGSIRLVWRPALALATAGVAVTSVLTGVVAIFVLDLPWLHGMLLGAIVGSTDAAAVFAVLRSSGLRLPERLGATLEVESGSNGDWVSNSTPRPYRVDRTGLLRSRLAAAPGSVWPWRCARVSPMNAKSISCLVISISFASIAAPLRASEPFRLL